MFACRIVAGLVVLLLSFACRAATAPEESGPVWLPALAAGDEPIVVTTHEIQTADGPLKYEVRTGRLPIRVEETGEVRARIFFVAYVVKSGGSQRPVTFAWNGGPTVPSIYLHTELLGPRRITRGGFVDNPQTLLSRTDLVFYDAVETGFSRPERPEFAGEFLNMRGDVAATGEFIRAYRTRFGAEAQPLFLCGESYGVWRAAAVSGLLAERGVAIAGVILISGGFPGVPMPFVFDDAMHVPARTATAFFYKRLPPELMRDRNETLQAANAWALSTYLPALTRRDQLSEGERESIAQSLARFTGLRAELVDRQRLVVNTSDYLNGFFCCSKKRVLSDTDARLSEPQPEDPLRAFYVSRYLRGELGYATDLSYSGDPGYSTDAGYRALEVGYMPTPGPPRRSTGAQWSYNQSDHAAQGFAQARATGDVQYLSAENAPWLENAMLAERGLRVFVATGRFDPLNMCEGQVLLTAKLEADLSWRVVNKCYEGGHMMYRDESARTQLSADLAEFVSGTTKRGLEPR